MFRGVINPTLAYKLTKPFDQTIGGLDILCDRMVEHLRVLLHKHLRGDNQFRSMLGRVDDLYVLLQQPAVVRRALEEIPSGKLEWSIDFFYISIERVSDDPP